MSLLALTTACRSRALNIFMDVELFAVFKTSASRPPCHSSPFTSLGLILSQAPHLQSLRIQVAECTGPQSPWTKTYLVRPCGIPIGSSLESALRGVPVLKEMKAIELDAFSDIASLLRITPNLEKLSMNLPSGYAQYTNFQLLAGLLYVPRLRMLNYSAESLRVGTLQRVRDSTQYTPEMEADDEKKSIELISAIGKALPSLETLDLQSRWYGVGHDILFPFSADVIANKVRSNIILQRHCRY